MSNVLRLTSDGDAPVSRLFDAYIKAYDVTLNGNEWLRWSIKTPLALKIFCELYNHKEVEEIERSSITITNLLNKKIEKIDFEFRSTFSYGYDANDNIVKKSLLILSEYFYQKNQIEKNKLLKMISEINSLENAAPQECRDLIRYLEDYGLLYSVVNHPSSFLEDPKIYYEIGIQPIYDYLYAIIIIEKIKRNSFEKLPDNLRSNNGTLQMASIILLNDYNTLLSDYSVFERSLNNNDLYDLIFYALVNVSPLIAIRYVPLIKSLLTQGAFAVKAITNKVFLNVARIENHPLSPLILHEFLMEFENAGQRDLFWSVPSILVFSKFKWSNRIDLNLQDETYKLTCTDKALGLPLIYAWSLTSVDNVKRAYYRKELFNWSILQPLEFIELFKITYQTNDPQMKEELLSIAMGIVFTMPTDSLVIDKFGKWVLEEVFADGKIQNTFDAAIRYYSRAIAERAYSCGFISQKQILECRPPYKNSNKRISMNIDATEGTVMSGYGPIDYDLSRYVLCDSIKSQFFNLPFGYDRKDNSYVYYKEADEFLSVHAKQLNLNNMECHQFVLSASYSYLLNCGWNEEDFYGKPNGGKKGEILGADIAIIRQYHPATHGSKSNVMSFAEKYVWCAKNEILGYLADRLPFCDDDIQHMVEDYGVLEDLIIPAQELDQLKPEGLSDNKKWYLPEKLSPTIDYLQNRTEKDIIQWINTAPIPNFELWININKQGHNVLLDYDIDLLALYSYNCQTEHNTGVETMMWISSGFMHDTQFELFLNELDNNDLLHIFREPERFTASTESSCYLTPKEICWMTWKKDKNS